jgi:hypothetical protein
MFRDVPYISISIYIYFYSMNKLPALPLNIPPHNVSILLQQFTDLNVLYRICGLVVRVPGYRSSCPGFDSRHYQIFWEVVGLEWGPLSLVSTTEELLERKNSGSGLESREYDRRNPSRWQRGAFYPQKLALTLPTSGGRSVGIVLSRTRPRNVCSFVRLNAFLLPFHKANTTTATLLIRNTGMRSKNTNNESYSSSNRLF